MARKKALCAYCGGPATTSDHVPPKGLYSKPLPENMFTVPACRECNIGAAQDDEYFRTVMSVRHDTYDHPDATGAAERTMRALVRDDSVGFRKSFLAGLREVNIVSPTGLYLGKGGQLDVNMPRVIKVVERIFRGLYFHHHGKPLPSESRVSVYPLESHKPNTPGFDVVRQFVEMAISAERHVLPRNVVEYRFRENPDDSATAVWLIAVYRVVPFVVISARRALAG